MDQNDADSAAAARAEAEKSGATAARGLFARGPRPVVEDPKDLAFVLNDELDFIRARRACFGAVPPDDRAGRDLEHFTSHAHGLQLAALCLSGGGIRSAAFALGVIQALATRGLLKHFDYLSTVSGGGYIGSFLTAWVQRTNYDVVTSALNLNSAPATNSPLAHLRRYSRYLTPSSGLLSADTLTIVALFARNLLLNWLIIFPFVIAAIVLVKLGALLIWLVDSLKVLHGRPAALGSIALALIGSALVDSLRQRPGWESESSKDLRFTTQELVPLALGAFVAMVAAATTSLPAPDDVSSQLWSVVGTGAAMGLTIWLVAFYFSRDKRRKARETGYVDDAVRASTRTTIADTSKQYVFGTAISFTIAGVVAGLAAASFIHLFPLLRPDWLDRSLAIIVFGPALVMAALYFGELIYTGLTSNTPWADAEREWLARAAGYHGLVAGTYVIATGLILLGSPLVFAFTREFAPAYGPQIIATAGGISGILIAALGKAPATAAMVREHVNTWTSATYRVILAIATPVFLASLTVLISWKFDDIFLCGPLDPDLFASAKRDCYIPLGNAVAWSLAIVVGLVLTGLIAARFININRFSLHNLYRNRLVRAFLGASNAARRPNAFTDLDERDNLKLCEIWPGVPVPEPGEEATVRHKPQPPPQYLVVNMTLNALSSADLKLQERKAISFIATPRFVGTGDRSWQNTSATPAVTVNGCFRPAAEYNAGMTLGTAVTVSGAAASPNMGYHSSPSLGVLLTMFNVRLGMWAGNPGPEGARTFTSPGPRPAFQPLYWEAMGLTTTNDEYVYLSDGGHFENLGAYEMIRRRCRFIVITDAGCDPDFGYEDLGNLVRKVSIDFGVRIKFRRPLDPEKKISPFRGEYCALADIYYPDDEVPAAGGASPAALARGLLLYVKPGMYGTEPTSVISYFNQHPEFPHETTANQWFGESQFEAYRALGAYVMDELLAGTRPGPGTEIADLFAELDKKYPPT